VHILTPESGKTVHYHFAAAMPPGTNMTSDEADHFSALRRHAFEAQDKPIINAQQAAVGDKDFWDMKPVLLNIDAGPVRMRRAIERMVKEDAAIEAAAVPSKPIRVVPAAV
jgi:vanillate O-demethylase monooxygenase subunit